MKTSSRLRSEIYGGVQSSALLDNESSEKRRMETEGGAKRGAQMRRGAQGGGEARRRSFVPQVLGHARIAYKYAHTRLRASGMLHPELSLE